MRLDKWLKVSRLIKRRTVANEACDAGRVSANGRPVKASYDVKAGDVLELKFGEKLIRVEVLSVADIVGKADEYKLGARGLRSICEAIMIDAMYDVPSSGETSFTVTLPYAKKRIEGANFLELKQVG